MAGAVSPGSESSGVGGTYTRPEPELVRARHHRNRGGWMKRPAGEAGGGDSFLGWLLLHFGAGPGGRLGRRMSG
jgi:hypothetical protein